LQIEKLKQELLNQKDSAKHLIKLEKERELQKFKMKFDDIISSAQKLIKQIKKGELSSSKTLHLKSAILKKEFTQEKPVIKISTPPSLHAVIPTDIIENHSYYCTKSENMVKVVSINEKKQNAIVMHKHFKFSCPLSTLFINKDKADEVEQSIQSYYISSSQLSIEVKCLGMRLEEFQELVEKYLTAIQLEEIPYAIITHGHGDGVLKNWLRKTITKRKEFSWCNVEGNDGQTRIDLL
jgi:DNA mismatch repair protein MutS2